MRQVWSEEELERDWALTEAELALASPIHKHLRLGFVIQLKHLEFVGRFPHHRGEVPVAVSEFLARHLGADPGSLTEYPWKSGRTLNRHRALIRAHLGYRPSGKKDMSALRDHLLDFVTPTDPKPASVREEALIHLRSMKIEPPTPARLDRLIASALNEQEQRYFIRIGLGIGEHTKRKLDELLVPVREDGIAPLAELRSEPKRPGVDSINRHTDRLAALSALELPDDVFESLPAAVLKTYRARVATEPTSSLRDRSDVSRYALLATYLWCRRREVVDELVDLLIHVTHGMTVRAERKVLLEQFKKEGKVQGKQTLFFNLAVALVENLDMVVRDAISSVVTEETLQRLIDEYKTAGPGFQYEIHSVVRSSYKRHYRRALPLILSALEFRSNNTAHKPLIEALDAIRSELGSKQRFHAVDAVPIDGVIRPIMKDHLLETGPDGEVRVNRINYEIAVLEALRKQVRCKEVWVVGADRYRNPDEDLPKDFEERRAVYYESLSLPHSPQTFIGTIKNELRKSLASLNKTMPGNALVKISALAGGRIAVSPLEAQPEAREIGHLKSEIQRRWPNTGLLDVLKEADLQIHFTGCFKTAASRQQIDPVELQRRLLLCLYGLGTNTGLKRVSAGRLGVSYRELRYVRRRFIHKDALREAIIHVVNATLAARKSSIWGSGTTSCASDSKRFGAWDQNLMTEWHVRYGGPGVMIYWHVDKKSMCIHSQLKRCSSSEAAAMIEGVLRHCTEMSVDRQYVDTHGQSEVAFGLTRLLGFDLLPRLKAISRQKLYVPESASKASLRNLEPVLRRPIRWDLIEQQYDEMIKYAVALREGTADAESILRRFTRNNAQHPTYKALIELGKATKTIFLCRYLESESLRREIHEGLNVVENWNSANSFIFFGKSGELASNRFQDQEVSALALHLLQICLVYVNTLMIQNVLEDPDWMNRLQEPDRRAVTPLLYHHVNPYGTFELDLSERIPLATAA